MKFFALTVAPDGTMLQLRPEQMLLPQERWTSLYRQSKELMLNGEDFARPIEANGTQYLVRFRRAGKTAAWVAFLRLIDPKTPKLDAMTALLSGLDDAEDAKLLATLRGNKNLQFCSAAEWERLKSARRPVGITFFLDEAALNNRAIHALVSILIPAYFDLLGLAQE
jgi:hypothetical protein